MIRTIAITAALAAAAMAAAPSPARTYGGVTLSFGTGGYDPYGYGYETYGSPYSGYYADPWQSYPSYYAAPRSYSFYYRNGPAYGWRDYERREQIARWRQEQERRRYWELQRRARHHWYSDDDDDGD